MNRGIKERPLRTSKNLSHDLLGKADFIGGLNLSFISPTARRGILHENVCMDGLWSVLTTANMIKIVQNHVQSSTHAVSLSNQSTDNKLELKFCSRIIIPYEIFSLPKKSLKRQQI